MYEQIQIFIRWLIISCKLIIPRVSLCKAEYTTFTLV